MSQRWLKFLEKFGTGGKKLPGGVNPEEFEGTEPDPETFQRYEVLFHLYGPLADSPWVPYHCPTLFAGIDKLFVRPRTTELSELSKKSGPAGAWQWLGPETMVIVDLPGSKTIEIGVRLMEQAAQFVCTFDHWPSSTANPTAPSAIESDKLIHTIYTLAPEVQKLRAELDSNAAPVWLCDSRRLGDGIDPLPGTFDNRYFIDDSILAGIETLKKGGIERVVYVNEKINKQPLSDLTPFFVEADNNGLHIEQVSLDEKNTWKKPRAMDVPFKTKLPIKGFRRSDMGGFGQMVPEPSEGSYGSGGYGG